MRKSEGSGRRARISPRISAALIEDDALGEIAEGVVEGLLQASPSWVRSLFRLGSVASLNEMERAALASVAKKLGSNIDLSVPGALHALEERFTALVERVRGLLTAAATAKVTAALEFEYSRIDSDESVFEAEIDISTANARGSETNSGSRVEGSGTAGLQPSLPASPSQDDVGSRRGEDVIGLEVEGSTEAGDAASDENERMTSLFSTTRSMSGATGPDTGFERLHTALAVGRLEEAAVFPGITVRSFLNQRSFQVERSWGASLSVGPFDFGGTDLTRAKSVVRTDRMSGRRDFSFRGMRSYRATWGKARFGWKATLAVRSPTARERARGRRNPVSSLYLLSERQARVVGENELLEILDSAVSWGILPPTSVPLQQARFAEMTAGADEIDVSLHLRLGDRAFTRMLLGSSQISDEALARALAEAMPWHPLFPVRRWPASRRQLYSDLWLRYLESGGKLGARDLAGLAASAFRRLGLESLSAFEAEASEPRTGSLAELARANPETAKQWESFREGSGLLLALIHSSEPELPASTEEDAAGLGGEQPAYADPDPDFTRAFNQLSAVWGQSHHLRALGAYLRHALSGDPKLWKDTKRILRVGYRRGGERTVENITP